MFQNVGRRLSEFQLVCHVFPMHPEMVNGWNRVPGAMSVQSLPLLLQELGLEPRCLLEKSIRPSWGRNIAEGKINREMLINDDKWLCIAARTHLRSEQVRFHKWCTCKYIDAHANTCAQSGCIVDVSCLRAVPLISYPIFVILSSHASPA